MTDLWQLPRQITVGGRDYPIHADYRDILQIIGYLDEPALPEFIRWQVALALFYEDRIPPEHRQQAMEQLAEFIRCGAPDTPGPRLLDWQQDAPAIISDINKAAGQELRSLPYLHWWTFLGWFHAIGQGQLSTLVSIRDKLRRGQKLDAWEKDFYRQNKDRVELQKRRSPEEEDERARLLQLLDGPLRSRSVCGAVG